MAAGRRAAVLLSLSLLILPTAGASEQGGGATQPERRVSQVHQDHALVGTIWSAREGRVVSRDELLDALSTTSSFCWARSMTIPSTTACALGYLASSRAAERLRERMVQLSFSNISAPISKA